MRKMKVVLVLVLLALLLSAETNVMMAKQNSGVWNHVASSVPVESDLKAEGKAIFLEGYVSCIEGNKLTIENKERLSTLLITNKTRLWKGKVTLLDQVEPGDYVYAWGTLESRGEIVTAKVWVNIANFYGTIADIRSDGLTLRVDGNSPDTLLTVHVNTDTLLDEERVNLKALGLSLSRAQFMQALGVYQKDGSLVATRLWTSSPGNNVAVTHPLAEDICRQSSDPGYDVQGRGTYVGTASWFCCGSSYGPCGNAGGGSCGGCQSSQYHAAWPKLKRPGYPNCDYSGCGMSLPGKSCGSLIRVKSKCNYRNVWVTVKDCGPAQKYYCNMGVGCGSCSLCSALVDLTPRAFSRIADLDLGRIPVEVYP